MNDGIITTGYKITLKKIGIEDCRKMLYNHR